MAQTDPNPTEEYIDKCNIWSNFLKSLETPQPSTQPPQSIQQALLNINTTLETICKSIVETRNEIDFIKKEIIKLDNTQCEISETITDLVTKVKFKRKFTELHEMLGYSTKTYDNTYGNIRDDFIQLQNTFDHTIHTLRSVESDINEIRIDQCSQQKETKEILEDIGKNCEVSAQYADYMQSMLDAKADFHLQNSQHTS